MINLAIAVGVIAIAALGYYIYRQFNQLAEVKRQQLALRTQQEKEHSEKQTYVSDSIRIIVKSVSTGQIEVVEAGIRLKVLLDQLQPRLSEQHFEAIEQVFEKTQHIPKLKAWKALSKVQRSVFETEMKTVDKQHQEGVKVEAQEIEVLMAQRS